MSALVFFAALIAPLLYACSNHIDKILLEKYFKGDGGVGTLMLFSSLLTLLGLPVYFYLDPTIFEVSLFEIAILAFVGMLNLALLWAYFQAMSRDEPTVVIIYYQMVPVFGLVLSYLILGESITLMQGMSMALIIVGALVMTVSSNSEGKLAFRFKTAAFMFAASLGWAAEATLFKKVALQENVVRSLFWQGVAMVLIGIALFVLVRHYRRSFLGVFKTNSASVVGLNVLNEFLFIVGNAAASFVVVLIPVALNLLMNSFQPIFVFVIGVLLQRFFPGSITEKSTDHLLQKIAAIALTGIGVFLLGVH
jgi:drug/metabolite transporter (DMT)-like permease